MWFGSRATQFTIDNLSLGGARLIGTMALRLGQHIDIELDLDTGPVKVTGEVVRVDTPDLLEDQIAVRFLEPPADAKTAIRDVVMRQLAETESTVSDGDDDLTDAAAAKPRRPDPVAGKLGDDEPSIELDVTGRKRDPEADVETNVGEKD